MKFVSTVTNTPLITIFPFAAAKTKGPKEGRIAKSKPKMGSEKLTIAMEQEAKGCEKLNHSYFHQPK